MNNSDIDEKTHSGENTSSRIFHIRLLFLLGRNERNMQKGNSMRQMKWWCKRSERIDSSQSQIIVAGERKSVCIC